MNQIVQDLKSGKTILAEVPVPKVTKGHLLIKTHRSLVSLGTEKMLVEFGKANWIDKARQQPEKVKQVLDKIQSDGLKPTVEAVFRKLNEPLPLGYCNAGEVIEVGESVTNFKVGDRVISNGYHAEVVLVPENLVAKIPDEVTWETAAFTVVAAIALQGIRLVQPNFGETIVVSGLGLIGLLTVQLLKANGCEVIGFDYDAEKVAIAKKWGIQAFDLSNGQNSVAIVNQLTNQVGCDAVLITASTKENSLISEAAQMSRKRGTIVLVGVIGLNIQRADFYEKELTFQVSCSYGPGRYDSNYENKGLDYPLPYVRWTENRNFQAILKAMAKGQLDLKSLISEVVALEDYEQTYQNIGQSKSIATLFKYNEKVDLATRTITVGNRKFKGQKGVIGIIGAGNFTKSTILPSLKKIKVNIKYIASAKGLSGVLAAKKFGIQKATTDFKEILNDLEVDAVIIATRHDLHASQVIQALQANKHVFVEKPLALNYEELVQIETAWQQTDKTLMVGFNRRFSPFIQQAQQVLGADKSGMNVVVTINAGFIPLDSWVQDLSIGGGRIIGEACHLVDLISALTESQVVSVVMNASGKSAKSNADNASILLKYKNGAQGIINYFSNGNKAYAKERIEVYQQGKTLIIDNFRKSTLYGFKQKGLKRTQDKGHFKQFETWSDALKSDGEVPINFASLMNTSKTVIGAIESLKNKCWIDV